MNDVKKSKGDTEENGTSRRAFVRPAVVILAMILTIAVLMKGGILELFLMMDFSFLLLPALLAFIVVLCAEIVGAILSGTFIPSIRKAFYVLAVGVFLYFLLSNEPLPEAGRPTALPLMSLLVIAACYVPIHHFTKELPIVRALTKSATLFLIGLTVWWLLSSVQFPTIEIPLPTIFFWGFTFSAATAFVSSLEYSNNPYLSILGKWTGRWIGHAFLLGAFLALYFACLRFSVFTLLGTWLIITEWIVICVTASVGFWLLRGAVKRSSKPLMYSDLAKHVQTIKTKEDPEVIEVAKLIRDFIDRGHKSKILVYMITTAGASGVPKDRIARAVEELAEYKEPPMPKIALRWDVERMKKANREKRIKLLKNTIKEFEKL